MTVEKDRRTYLSLSNVLTGLLLFVALGGGWITLANENTRTVTRVETLEIRQAEDRQEMRDSQKALLTRIDKISTAVQEILQEIRITEGIRKREETSGSRDRYGDPRYAP